MGKKGGKGKGKGKKVPALPTTMAVGLPLQPPSNLPQYKLRPPAHRPAPALLPDSAAETHRPPPVLKLPIAIVRAAVRDDRVMRCASLGVLDQVNAQRTGPNVKAHATTDHLPINRGYDR